jgi:hypothetical protein
MLTSFTTAHLIADQALPEPPATRLAVATPRG